MESKFYYTSERNVQIIIALLKAHGIHRVIVSPGTTNMTFVVSIENDPWFKLWSSVDERSAAYLACGMAAETGEPVVLSCTGATASRNYMPGLTEAYYRKLPVLAITSTRGNHKVGHLIDQQIDRRSIPNDIAMESVTIPMVRGKEDERMCEIEANKAILALKLNGGGPAHINLYTRYSHNFSVREIPHVNAIFRHTAFEEQIMAQGKKLINKIFNASKFAMTIVANSGISDYSVSADSITNETDKSWLYKLSSSLEGATKYFSTFDYAGALEVIEKRFWDFCDNYLEIIKKRAYSEDNRSAVLSLVKSIDVFVRAFAPFCPFVTEEIYQALPWNNGRPVSVHLTTWPTAQEFAGIISNDVLYESISQLTSEVRKAKTEANLTQKTPVKKLVIAAPAKVISLLSTHGIDLENVTNAYPNAIEYIEGSELSISKIELDLDFVPENKKKQDVVG